MIAWLEQKKFRARGHQKPKAARDSVMVKPWIGAVLCASFIPLLILFFKPTFLELAGFYAVDFLSFVFVSQWELRLFRRFFPLTRDFFPEVDESIFNVTQLDQRLKIFEEAMKLPLRRALWVGIMSPIKVIPGFIYGFLVWGGHEPLLYIFFKGAAICAFTFSFYVGICYLEYHNLISDAFKRIHEKCNWSEVFRLQTPSKHKQSFLQFELLCAASVWITWVAILILVVVDKEQSQTMAIAQVVYVSLVGLGFVGALLATSRKQVTRGIESLVAYHRSSQDQVNPSGVAMSTYPTLAWFQLTVNQLVERNVSSEREIHRWIVKRAEQHRYLDLGHITGLLVHDLVTPLTVMRHCLSTLEEQDLEPATRHLYNTKLRFCLNQITELVINVRGSIRDKTHGLKQASPDLAHKTALQLVTYLYQAKPHGPIEVVFNVPSGFSVAMPQPELNQVFLNLYSNSFQNLSTHSIPNAQLVVDVIDDGKEYLTICFRDNGTGLSAEKFDFITEEAQPLSGSEGIGLKLTKRLVELYGGLLSVDELHADEPGTRFHLSLPKKTQMRHKYKQLALLAQDQENPEALLRSPVS